MNSTFDAFVRSWPWEPWLLAGLFVTAWIYVRGWRQLRQRDPDRWGTFSAACFLGGLLTLFIALASPLEPFSSLLLSVHMVQHLLLMMVVPPLLWLGAPFFPFLRGLPQAIRAVWVVPLLRWRPLRRLFSFLTHPGPAWLLFVAATWLWHLPAAYELALRSPMWHYAQHVTFFLTALLFWYPVVRPYPSRPQWSPWLLLPYLILADVQNTALSALLCFSPEPLYPHYARLPAIAGRSPLEDQAVAGAIMWVPGAVAFLVPVFVIGVRLLYSIPSSKIKVQSSKRIALPLISSAAAAPDLLRTPLLGGFLKWRHSRLAVQLPLLLLAGIVIYDGLTGPEAAPLNLAGVLPWIHWRGLVVLGLLAAGNIFCFACPFLVPRTLARRFLPQGRAWPRVLRTKWPAIALVAIFLWGYEAFALWNSPWWTAWIALGYFLAAFAIDGVFRGAAFCKYVCPIGQFNFVQSLVSPLEVKVRELETCTICTTKDCIRGRDAIPGCELHLFQPRKHGNFDCTFCLDCVHACPHDNVGLLAVTPGKELWHDPPRSGIGRFSRRFDVAVLIVVLAFGAFTNAAGMTGPVLDAQTAFRAWAGVESTLLGTTLLYAFALVLIPTFAVTAAAWLSQRLANGRPSVRETASRFALALIPLGFAMWLAHYSFHLFTSYATAVPTVQRFALAQGWAGLGEPAWEACCCVAAPGWLLRLEILFLDLGLLLSLYTAYRIGRGKAWLPWATLLIALFAVGIWVLFQPMEMRGTL